MRLLGKAASVTVIQRVRWNRPRVVLEGEAPEATPSHLAARSACPAGGREHMHTSHRVGHARISLPPGIMRDRALAERDLVTLPETFFFSVFSNRCRATWEAGSLDGLEELSALSTHSLRPFI